MKYFAGLLCKRKKVMPLLMIMIFLISMVLFYVPSIATTTFSISPAAVPYADLAGTTFTVSIAGATFDGDVTVYVYDGASQVASAVVGNPTEDADSVSFSLNSAVLTTGKYYGIRLQDNSVTYAQATVGSIGVGPAALSSSMTALSLANTYTTPGTLVISGDYTNFTDATSVVKLVKGAEETTIASRTIDNSRQITATIPAGLTGTYNVKVTSGTEEVTKASMVVVRSAPSFTVTTEKGDSTLAKNYTSNGTITIAGTNTGFATGQSTIRILKNSVAQDGVVSDITVSSSTALTFKLLGTLAVGTYVAEITTGEEIVTSQFTVETPTAAVTKSGTAFSTINQGYTSAQSLVITASNVILNSSNSTLELFDGVTEVDGYISATNISHSTVTDQSTVTFTIATGLNSDTGGSGPKTYTLRITEGTIQLDSTFQVLYPSSTVSHGHTLKSTDGGTFIPEGYKRYTATATGTNTLFQATTKAKIYASGDLTTALQTQSVLEGVTATSAQFYVDENLAVGSYTIKIDMDGGDTITNDIITVGTFTVRAGSIIARESGNPVDLVRTVQGTKTITVTGTNTHFTSNTPSISLLDTNGDVVNNVTIANVVATSDTALTFDITPSTISTVGDYGLKVQTTLSNVIDETVRILAGSSEKIVVSIKSLELNPAALFTYDAGATTMVMTVLGLDLTDTVIVKMDINGDGDYTDTVGGTTEATLTTGLSQSSVANTVSFTIPSGLTLANNATGAGTIKVIDTDSAEVETSYTFVDESDIVISNPSKTFEYETFNMTITGGDGLKFNTGLKEPSAIKITMPDGTAVTNASGNTVSDITSYTGLTADDSTTIIFAFPTDLLAGSYKVKVEWDADSSYHVYSTLTDFTINNLVSDLYMKNGVTRKNDGTSIDLFSTEGPLTLTAFAEIATVADTDKTALVTWSEANDSNGCITVNNTDNKGRVTLDATKDGTPQVVATYDGQTVTITLNIKVLSAAQNGSTSQVTVAGHITQSSGDPASVSVRILKASDDTQVVGPTVITITANDYSDNISMPLGADNSNYYAEVTPLGGVAYNSTDFAYAYTSAGIVTGYVKLNGQLGLAVESQNHSGITVTEQGTANSTTTSTTGQFTLTGVTPGGNVTLVFTKANYLTRTIPTLTVVDAQTLTLSTNASSSTYIELWAGDFNGASGINMTDLSQFIATFGKVSGDEGFNANCDFNGVSGVNMTDLSILIAKFGNTTYPAWTIP